MTNLQSIVLIVHTIIALAIIVLVLLQRGKGATAGAAFGSGSSGTVFGARGSSNFFSRATAVMATAFFASSLALAYLSSQRAGSVDSLLENAAPVEIEETLDEAADAADEAGDDAEAALEAVEADTAEALSADEAVPEEGGEQ